MLGLNMLMTDWIDDEHMENLSSWECGGNGALAFHA